MHASFSAAPRSTRRASLPLRPAQGSRRPSSVSRQPDHGHDHHAGRYPSSESAEVRATCAGRSTARRLDLDEESAGVESQSSQMSASAAAVHPLSIGKASGGCVAGTSPPASGDGGDDEAGEAGAGVPPTGMDNKTRRDHEEVCTKEREEHDEAYGEREASVGGPSSSYSLAAASAADVTAAAASAVFSVSGVTPTSAPRDPSSPRPLLVEEEEERNAAAATPAPSSPSYSSTSASGGLDGEVERTVALLSRVRALLQQVLLPSIDSDVIESYLLSPLARCVEETNTRGEAEVCDEPSAQRSVTDAVTLLHGVVREATSTQQQEQQQRRSATCTRESVDGPPKAPSALAKATPKHTRRASASVHAQLDTQELRRGLAPVPVNSVHPTKSAFSGAAPSAASMLRAAPSTAAASLAGVAAPDSPLLGLELLKGSKHATYYLRSATGHAQVTGTAAARGALEQHTSFTEGGSDSACFSELIEKRTARDDEANELSPSGASAIAAAVSTDIIDTVATLGSTAAVSSSQFSEETEVTVRRHNGSRHGKISADPFTTQGGRDGRRMGRGGGAPPRVPLLSPVSHKKDHDGTPVGGDAVRGVGGERCRVALLPITAREALTAHVVQTEEVLRAYKAALTTALVAVQHREAVWTALQRFLHVVGKDRSRRLGGTASTATAAAVGMASMAGQHAQCSAVTRASADKTEEGCVDASSSSSSLATSFANDEAVRGSRGGASAAFPHDTKRGSANGVDAANMHSRSGAAVAAAAVGVLPDSPPLRATLRLSLDTILSLQPPLLSAPASSASVTPVAGGRGTAKAADGGTRTQPPIITPAATPSSTAAPAASGVPHAPLLPRTPRRATAHIAPTPTAAAQVDETENRDETKNEKKRRHAAAIPLERRRAQSATAVRSDGCPAPLSALGLPSEGRQVRVRSLCAAVPSAMDERSPQQRWLLPEVEKGSHARPPSASRLSTDTAATRRGGGGGVMLPPPGQRTPRSREQRTAALSRSQSVPRVPPVALYSPRPPPGQQPQQSAVTPRARLLAARRSHSIGSGGNTKSSGSAPSLTQRVVEGEGRGKREEPAPSVSSDARPPYTPSAPQPASSTQPHHPPPFARRYITAAEAAQISRQLPSPSITDSHPSPPSLVEQPVGVVSLEEGVQAVPRHVYAACLYHYLFYLQRTSLAVVEAVAVLRGRHWSGPAPLVVEHRNYLLEMMTQTAALAGDAVLRWLMRPDGDAALPAASPSLCTPSEAAVPTPHQRGGTTAGVHARGSSARTESSPVRPDANHSAMQSTPLKALRSSSDVLHGSTPHSPSRGSPPGNRSTHETERVAEAAAHHALQLAAVQGLWPEQMLRAPLLSTHLSLAPYAGTPPLVHHLASSCSAAAKGMGAAGEVTAAGEAESDAGLEDSASAAAAAAARGTTASAGLLLLRVPEEVLRVYGTGSGAALSAPSPATSPYARRPSREGSRRHGEQPLSSALHVVVATALKPLPSALAARLRRAEQLLHREVAASLSFLHLRMQAAVRHEYPLYLRGVVAVHEAYVVQHQRARRGGRPSISVPSAGVGGEGMWSAMSAQAGGHAGRPSLQKKGKRQRQMCAERYRCVALDDEVARVEWMEELRVSWQLLTSGSSSVE